MESAIAMECSSNASSAWVKLYSWNYWSDVSRYMQHATSFVLHKGKCQQSKCCEWLSANEFRLFDVPGCWKARTVNCGVGQSWSTPQNLPHLSLLESSGMDAKWRSQTFGSVFWPSELCFAWCSYEDVMYLSPLLPWLRWWLPFRNPSTWRDLPSALLWQSRRGAWEWQEHFQARIWAMSLWVTRCGTRSCDVMWIFGPPRFDRWVGGDIVQAMAYDNPIPGFVTRLAEYTSDIIAMGWPIQLLGATKDTYNTNNLRLWRACPSKELA